MTYIVLLMLFEGGKKNSRSIFIAAGEDKEWV